MHTPDWVKHAVFYQIFPDRFARSGEGFFSSAAYLSDGESLWGAAREAAGPFLSPIFRDHPIPLLQTRPEKQQRVDASPHDEERRGRLRTGPTERGSMNERSVRHPWQAAGRSERA